MKQLNLKGIHGIISSSGSEISVSSSKEGYVFIETYNKEFNFSKSILLTNEAANLLYDYLTVLVEDKSFLKISVDCDSEIEYCDKISVVENIQEYEEYYSAYL